MERETRIELATNSLEGCDSTIELLPLYNFFYHLYAALPEAKSPDRRAMAPLRTKNSMN